MKRAYRDLPDFLDTLREEGELLVVEEEVDPVLEITAITDRFCKSPGGGPALYFQRCKGSPFPLVINLLGSFRRMELALGGLKPEAIAAEIAQWIHLKPPEGLAGKLKLLPQLAQLAKFPPRTVKRAPCQEVVRIGHEVDITRLPVLQCWPEDGGRFVTFGNTYTKSLDGSQVNCGMYRQQIFDGRTTAMHWQIHHDGSHFWQEYRRAGKRMEVALAIGNDPATVFSAVAPLPRGIDEMLFSGFLRQSPVQMVKCKTVDLKVPANAEFVIEGYIEPDEMRREGPFGDHTGYYSLADDYPVLHVTALTHKRNPVYLTTIVGTPPMEDCYMGKAIEQIFLPLLHTQWPEIEAMNLPWEGVFHNNVCLTMAKDYPMQARRLMSALWGSGQMSLAKSIVVGDPGDPVDRPLEFLATVLDRIRIPESLTVTEGVVDVLDHSAPQPLWGGKLGVDATTTIRHEPGFGQPFREPETAPSEEEALVAAKAVDPSVTRVLIPVGRSNNPLAVVWFDKTRPHQARTLGEALLKSKALESIAIFVLIESETDYPMDGAHAAWRAFNNTDAQRDIRIAGHRVTVDATKKWKDEGFSRPWPPDISMTPAVNRRMDDLWKRLQVRWNGRNFKKTPR